ncbi:hypothetical protein KC363_g230 [Hortaea werneckii]|nr:hypothetical protein KC363_g230 [Hortaea werneckii]
MRLRLFGNTSNGFRHVHAHVSSVFLLDRLRLLYAEPISSGASRCHGLNAFVTVSSAISIETSSPCSIVGLVAIFIFAARDVTAAAHPTRRSKVVRVALVRGLTGQLVWLVLLVWRGDLKGDPPPLDRVLFDSRLV